MASSLDVSPKELRFRADTKKQPPAVLYLTNSTSERVAFKTGTTAKYLTMAAFHNVCNHQASLQYVDMALVQACLQDVVDPNATVEVKVFMQSKELGNAVTAGECKDKFLIQSSPVAGDWKLVEEKLKVFLESPPAPPSPVPEASETTEFANASPTAGTTQRAVPGAALASSTVQYAGKPSGSQSQSQLEAENRDLREKLALMKVHQGESSAAAKVRGGSGKGGAMSTSADSHVTLLHLVLVAIVAYILGVYLHA